MPVTDITAAVDEALAEAGQRPGPLLEVFHAVQARLRHVPESAVPQIATALNLSRAEVHGALSFYHHFRTTPPGRHVVQLCRAEACLAVEGDAIAACAERHLGVSLAHGAATSADGAVTLLPVYCLGLCAQGPAALVDDQPVARLTPAKVAALLDGLRGEPSP